MVYKSDVLSVRINKRAKEKLLLISREMNKTQGEVLESLVNYQFNKMIALINDVTLKMEEAYK